MTTKADRFWRTRLGAASAALPYWPAAVSVLLSAATLNVYDRSEGSWDEGEDAAVEPELALLGTSLALTAGIGVSRWVPAARHEHAAAAVALQAVVVALALAGMMRGSVPTEAVSGPTDLDDGPPSGEAPSGEAPSGEPAPVPPPDATPPDASDSDASDNASEVPQAPPPSRPPSQPPRDEPSDFQVPWRGFHTYFRTTGGKLQRLELNEQAQQVLAFAALGLLVVLQWSLTDYVRLLAEKTLASRLFWKVLAASAATAGCVAALVLWWPAVEPWLLVAVAALGFAGLVVWLRRASVLQRGMAFAVVFGAAVVLAVSAVPWVLLRMGPPDPGLLVPLLAVSVLKIGLVGS